MFFPLGKCNASCLETLRLFSPLQHGELQLFYCCKFISRIDSQRLLLDDEILSCFLPCVNEIRPGPDLQCPVVTIASYSNYVETITLILSAHFRSMINKHCTGFAILNTQTETIMPL